MKLNVVLAILFSVFASSAAAKPNIIYILADDLGWTDLGCQGSQYYETPNIDRLASQGIRLQRYYNSQNCAPTRAALMSGQYAPRTGIYTVQTLDRGDASDRRMNTPTNENNLSLDRFILPQALKQAGYTTGMFGKWHLGKEGAYHPSQRGFDEAIEADNRHFNFKTTPTVAVPEGQYFADFITDRSVDFIERHQKKPFFLYVSHFAVHTPIHAKADSEKRGFTDNTPLRGGKGTLYEGGIRVPFIARWPGVIREGTINETPVAHVDIYPTFLEISGAKGRPGHTLDGTSFLPLLKNPKAKLPRDAIYWHFPGYLQSYVHDRGWRTTPVGVIHSGDFKLLEYFEDNRIELYNLRKDVGEKNNLAEKMPRQAETLRRKLASWRREVGADMPVAKN